MLMQKQYDIKLNGFSVSTRINLITRFQILTCITNMMLLDSYAQCLYDDLNGSYLNKTCCNFFLCMSKPSETEIPKPTE